MKISYLFPSRQRPGNFFKRLNEICEFSNTGDYEVIASLDENDETMNNDSVKSLLTFYSKLKTYYGVSENKIHACNRGVNKVSGDIIVLQSDDMAIIKKGFDDDIREAAKDFSGLIHFPDGRVNEKLCTYSIMTKDYLDMFGYIYHPEYKSVYCDNEQTEVAKLLGKYKYVDKQIIQHEHYRAGYGIPDALMTHNDSPEMYIHDRDVYQKRLLKNFDLDLSK